MCNRLIGLVIGSSFLDFYVGSQEIVSAPSDVVVQGRLCNYFALENFIDTVLDKKVRFLSCSLAVVFDRLLVAEQIQSDQKGIFLNSACYSIEQYLSCCALWYSASLSYALFFQYYLFFQRYSIPFSFVTTTTLLDCASMAKQQDTFLYHSAESLYEYLERYKRERWRALEHLAGV